MASSNDDILSLLTEQLVIGASIAATIPAVPYQVACQVKYGSGGTLFIIGGTFAVGPSIYGSTFTTAFKSIVGTNEAFSANLRGAITLGAEGATVTCYLVRGLSNPVR